MTFAEAKGLRSATIFTRYGMRNAILPQTTGLALALGRILSGAVLVEVVFGYPGDRHAAVPGDSRRIDYFVIYGIVFSHRAPLAWRPSCSTSSTAARSADLLLAERQLP